MILGKQNSQDLMTNLGKVGQNIIVRDYSQVLSYGYWAGLRQDLKKKVYFRHCVFQMSTGHPSIKQSKVNDCVSLKFRTEAQRLKSFKHNLLIVSPLYWKEFTDPDKWKVWRQGRFQVLHTQWIHHINKDKDSFQPSTLAISLPPSS